MFTRKTKVKIIHTNLWKPSQWKCNGAPLQNISILRDFGMSALYGTCILLIKSVPGANGRKHIANYPSSELDVSFWNNIDRYVYAICIYKYFSVKEGIPDSVFYVHSVQMIPTYQRRQSVHSASWVFVCVSTNHPSHQEHEGFESLVEGISTVRPTMAARGLLLAEPWCPLKKSAFLTWPPQRQQQKTKTGTQLLIKIKETSSFSSVQILFVFCFP